MIAYRRLANSCPTVVKTVLKIMLNRFEHVVQCHVGYPFSNNG